MYSIPHPPHSYPRMRGVLVLAKEAGECALSPRGCRRRLRFRSFNAELIQRLDRLEALEFESRIKMGSGGLFSRSMGETMRRVFATAWG